MDDNKTFVVSCLVDLDPKKNSLTGLSKNGLSMGAVSFLRFEQEARDGPVEESRKWRKDTPC